MNIKCITITWLAKADLSSLNSGQGSGNINELKLYSYGTKPYVSGQSLRTALFQTMDRMNEGVIKCISEAPCGDVENCWACDLRGYLKPEEGTGGTRRWSPLKVSPALGQLPTEIVSDLLTRHSYIDKGEDKKSKDQRIAHVQLTENVYRAGIVIDVANIGRVIEPIIGSGKKKNSMEGWKEVIDIGDEERRVRTIAVLDSIFNLSGFAKQARAATSLAPQLVFASIKDTYNQRGLNVLEMDDDGNVKLDVLESALYESKALGDEVFIGFTPGIIENEEAFKEVVEKNGKEVLPVVEVFNRLKAQL